MQTVLSDPAVQVLLTLAIALLLGLLAGTSVLKRLSSDLTFHLGLVPTVVAFIGAAFVLHHHHNLLSLVGLIYSSLIGWMTFWITVCACNQSYERAQSKERIIKAKQDFIERREQILAEEGHFWLNKAATDQNADMPPLLVAADYLKLGRLYSEVGKYETADSAYTAVLKILAKEIPNHPLYGDFLREYAGVLLHLGKTDDASALLKLADTLPRVPVSIFDLKFEITEITQVS